MSELKEYHAERPWAVKFGPETQARIDKLCRVPGTRMAFLFDCVEKGMSLEELTKEYNEWAKERKRPHQTEWEMAGLMLVIKKALGGELTQGERICGKMLGQNITEPRARRIVAEARMIRRGKTMTEIAAKLGVRLTIVTDDMFIYEQEFIRGVTFGSKAEDWNKWLKRIGAKELIKEQEENG